MKTLRTALTTLGVCTAARRCLEGACRQDAEYFQGRVRLTALWNEGAAFGLPVPRRLLPAVSGAALGAVWVLRKRSPAGAGLLLGGGASNLLERMCRGKVFDYIQFPKAPRPWRRYVFNLADFAVLAGGGALCLSGRKRG